MKYNLVIISQYKNKNDIYPAEQSILCKDHCNNNEKLKSLDNIQINKINSSMPEIWCNACNPMN